MHEPLKILIVEDVPTDAELMERALRDSRIDFESRLVSTKKALLSALQEFTPSLILSDYVLPGFDGMQVLEIARTRVPDVPVIIVTGSINEETAVECMKAGAVDYVLKHHLLRISPSVLAALEKKQAARERKAAIAALAESEKRYFSLFEDSPSPQWELGLTEVTEYLRSLKASGITDLAAHFAKQPEAVERFLSLVRVLDVNRLLLRLLKVEKKEELLTGFRKVFCPETYADCGRMLAMVSEGRRDFTLETRVLDFEGRQIDVIVSWSGPLDPDDSLSRVYLSLVDITERKRAEAALASANHQLEVDRRSLAQKNTALREILDQIETEKRRTAQHLQSNVDRVVMPIISKLEAKVGAAATEYVQLLKSGLNEITSPFISKLEAQFAKLTPREIEICSMIRNGLSSKEISSALDTSPETVRSQRKSIRKKLGIGNASVNLSTYLRALE